MAYELELLRELSPVYPIFHLSMLNKCIYDPVSILLLEGLRMNHDIDYEEVPVEIIDCQVKNLSNKKVISIKVLWRNNLLEGETWEADTDIISRYPHIFCQNTCKR